MKYLLILMAAILVQTLLCEQAVWIAADSDTPVDDLLRFKPVRAFRVLNLWGINSDNAAKTAGIEAPYIKELASKGIDCSGMMGFIAMDSREYSNDFRKENCTRDPSGNIISFDNSFNHGCTGKKAWMNEVIAIGSSLKGAECAYIEVDQPALENWRGECYCKKCIADFSKHLERSFTKEQLFDYFSINDVSLFTYTDYLKKVKVPGQGLPFASMNEGDRFEMLPLGKEFFHFHTVRNRDIIGNLVKQLKNLPQGKTEVPVFGNVWGLASEYLPVVEHFDVIDVACDLITPWIWNPDDSKLGPPLNSWVPVYKLAKALPGNREILAFLDTNGYERALSAFSNREALLNILSMEACGCGTSFVFPLANRVAPTRKDGFSLHDFEGIIPVYRKILEEFRNRETMAEVGLFMNYGSMMKDRFPKAYWGISYLLLSSQTEFDTVFSGTGAIFPDDLTILDLNKYKVVIVPYSDDLTDHQFRILWNYAVNGGKVLLSGERVMNHPNCARIKADFFAFCRDRSKPVDTRFQLALSTLLPKPCLKFSQRYPHLRLFTSVSNGEKRLLLVNADLDIKKNRINEAKGLSARIRIKKRPEKITVTGPGISNAVEFSYRYGEVEFSLPMISKYLYIRVEYNE